MFEMLENSRSKELHQQDAVNMISKEFSKEVPIHERKREPGDRQAGPGRVSYAHQGHCRLGEERLLAQAHKSGSGRQEIGGLICDERILAHFTEVPSPLGVG
jgi:hypothetical protein